MSRRVLHRSVTAAGLLLGALATPSPVAAGTPTTTPAVCTAPTPTAPPSLSVSKTTELDPAGEVLTVSGTGYFECHGIYVAFCVMPPPGQVPTPCGGGIDLSGVSGASQWISSFPPPYGVGLAIPYTPGGSFSVRIAVAPQLAAGIDCRQVQCAVVTRNDHTRPDDRAQDVLVPILFRPDAAAATTLPVGPAPTEPAPVETATPTVAPGTAPPTPSPTPSPTVAAAAATTPSSTTAATSTSTSSAAGTSVESTSVAPSSVAPDSVSPVAPDSVPPSSTPSTADGSSDGSGGGGSTAWVLTGVGAAAVSGAGATAWTRARRRPRSPR